MLVKGELNRVAAGGFEEGAFSIFFGRPLATRTLSVRSLGSPCSPVIIARDAPPQWPGRPSWIEEVNWRYTTRPTERSAGPVGPPVR